MDRLDPSKNIEWYARFPHSPLTPRALLFKWGCCSLPFNVFLAASLCLSLHLSPSLSLSLSLSLAVSRLSLALSLCYRSLVIEHSIITFRTYILEATFDNFDLYVLRVRNIFVGSLHPHVRSRKPNIRVASRFINRWRSHLQLPALRTANPIPLRNFPRPSIEVILGENDFGEGTETSTSSELGWHPSKIVETGRAPTARSITHSLPNNLKKYTNCLRHCTGGQTIEYPRIHIFESVRKARIIKRTVGGI
jgi:hypothetical protein